MECGHPRLYEALHIHLTILWNTDKNNHTHSMHNVCTIHTFSAEESIDRLSKDCRGREYNSFIHDAKHMKYDNFSVASLVSP